MPKKRRKRVIKKKSISDKLDEILRLERGELKEEKTIEKLERSEARELHHLDEEVEDLEKLEKKIKGQIGSHPLAKVTVKDVGKAFIGAFIGIVSHFAVLEGVHFAESIDFTRATSYFILSYFIGFVFLYYTGFRKIKQLKLLAVLPLRLTVVYLVMIASVAFAIYIFSLTNISLLDLYKQVAVVSLPGMIGASAADLIGE